MAAGLAPRAARAWGTLGHRMTAETAALLLEREAPRHPWGPLLARNRYALGYYANVPDTHFRREDGSAGRVEGPTHFFDLDLVLGTTRPDASDRARLRALPQDYAALARVLAPRLEGAAFLQAGSAPWRVAQLERRARERLAGVTRPEGRFMSGRDAKDQARAIYEGLYLLGVLAHYTADATVPHHATADFNGHAKGQGGIHFFFEADCVNALEPELSREVLREAARQRDRWLRAWRAGEESSVGLMWQVFLDSFDAIAACEATDRRHAIVRATSPGAKEFAVRAEAARACRSFRGQLIERLAKGAVVTAEIWRRALPTHTDFSAATELTFSDFETAPAYPAPDYLPATPPAK